MKNKAFSGVSYLDIDAEYAGQRVDNFLLTYLKGIPRSHIYQLLRKGEIRINKKRIKPEYRLQAHDVLRLPPLRIASSTPTHRVAPTRLVALIEQAIVYEDAALLVINKPSGMAVHGGSGVHFGVIELLRMARPEETALELVHRLDRDTSGCLMVAKKRSMLRQLHGLLRDNQIEKIYVTLVKGQWCDPMRRVSVPLQKNQLLSGERMVRVEEGGKEASTVFTLQHTFADASLLQARLETGRTHQIRVHAAHVGFPIAGDEKYGDKNFNKLMRSQGLKRLFLHAQSLSFLLPSSGQHYQFSAPLDPHLSSFINVLTK